MKKLLIVILAVLILAIGCKPAATKPFSVDSIQSYAEIPGITREEAEAIEALKASRENFSYGHLETTEAFMVQDGTYAGFTQKYCALLSGLFGIDFVPAVYEWDALLDSLEQKTIDFTGDLTPSPEREQKYFMTHSIAERSLRIYTRKDAFEIISESDLNGRRIGVLSGSIVLDTIRKMESISFEIVELGSSEAAATLLQSGGIDAFIGEGVSDPFFAGYDFIHSEEFFPLVYTPASMATANPELKPIISVINKYIEAGGIDKLNTLYQEGDFEYAKHKLFDSLSEEELAYLEGLAARGEKVSIAFEHENYPVSFYNKKEGEFQGFSVDILMEISRLTGIEFEAVQTNGVPWAEILNKLKSGEISMITELLYSDARKDDFIWSASPYASSYYALISKSSYPNLKSHQVIRAKVGTIDKTAFEDIYFEYFPDNGNTVSFANMEDGLKALESGQIDLLMATEYILLTQSNYLEKPGYKTNFRFNVPMDSYFGFSKDEAVLRSIVDKAQAYVVTDLLVDEWTGRVFDYSKTFLRELAYYLIAFVVILLIILGGVIFLLIKNKQLGKELKKMAHTDNLTGIHNRRFFVELASMCIKKAERSNTNAFVVIFDMDYFKKINDTHGHAAGDEVLKAIAARVKNTIRPYDLFARYGGEEFVLLITCTDTKEVMDIAERIRHCICDAPIAFDGISISVSASIGVAVATPLRDLDAAIRLADKALYRAKEEGRGRVVFLGDVESEDAAVPFAE